MPTRKASAAWEGGLREGKGSFKGDQGTFSGSYSFSRFSDVSDGTNPEELLAAAHASCFTMAFSAQLERNGTPPTRVETNAACTVEKVGEGFKITAMKLTVRGTVPNIDNAKFQELAKAALDGCPVSQALKGNLKMEVAATLA
jgi:osmotically inducible protein OsmC